VPLQPFLGGLFHDFGRGLVQPDRRLLDLPYDIRIHGREELPFVALGGFSAVGVEFCEHCLDDEDDPTTDLRLPTTDRLSEQDLCLYSQVARLIVPAGDPSTLAPAKLVGWAPWEIFDVIVTLTMILERRSNRWGGFGFVPRDERTRLDQNELTWHGSLIVAAQPSSIGQKVSKKSWC
jgi:hypothetical protein